MSSTTPLPAHQTKHIQTLQYPFLTHTFHLSQLADGRDNGTALWLGAQCLSAYLADSLHMAQSRPSEVSKLPNQRPRAIELGSGVGLTALALASLGWDVLATDTSSVVNSVLRPNVARNSVMLRESVPFSTTRCGNVQTRVLDWTIDPSEWCWNNSNSVATAVQDHDKQSGCDQGLLGPPFDLIVTADTVYLTSLVTPLLRTLNHLCKLSQQNHVVGKSKPHRPLVYVALENRDPGLLESFLKEAREQWGFSTARVPDRRIERALERRRMDWKREDWVGVQVWKLQFLTLSEK